MSKTTGCVPASPSGYSAEPEPSSTVSAVPVSIPNAYGDPVSTIEELDALNDDEIVEGYRDGRDNEPQPTGNRSRSYWHGWRNGMADAGRIPIDDAMRQLAHAVVWQSRAQSERTGA